MIDRCSGFKELLSLLFFLRYFPRSIFYQAAAAFAVITPFLGGALTITALIALVCLFPFVAGPAWYAWKWHLPVVVLVLIVLIWVAWPHLYGFPYQKRIDYSLFSIQLVIVWGGLYCIGLLFRPRDFLKARDCHAVHMHGSRCAFSGVDASHVAV
jgi:hypothetical protein